MFNKKKTSDAATSKYPVKETVNWYCLDVESQSHKESTQSNQDKSQLKKCDTLIKNSLLNFQLYFLN